VLIPGYQKGNGVVRRHSKNKDSANEHQEQSTRKSIKVKYPGTNQSSSKKVNGEGKISLEDEKNYKPLDIMVPHHKRMQESEGVAAFKQSQGSAIIQ
jgi:hypothetical protein